MLANKSSSTLYKTVMMAQTQMRFFGVLPKLPKVELTMRTPYKTFFANFNQFTRIYVHTQKGLIAIGNRSIPRIYLLPPGELTVKNIQDGKIINQFDDIHYDFGMKFHIKILFIGDGKFTNSDSGLFIHTGGWLFVHEYLFKVLVYHLF